jgi:hypothetical protein
MVLSAAAPALALDYEAKPIMWCIQAPYRTVGALSGAVIQGFVAAPVDGGFHGSIDGTNHVAGKFGDEKGVGQRVAAVPMGGSVGMMVGGTKSSYKGVGRGWKMGWDKPFSRWSYITMEEK